MRQRTYRHQLPLRTPVKVGEKQKSSRWPVVIFFFGTILLSFGLWFHDQLSGFWQSLTAPAIIKISNSPESRLIEVLGLKPKIADYNRLEQLINQLTEDLAGVYSVYFFDLQKKTSWGIKEDEVLKAASVNKVPIMVYFYTLVEKGKLAENGQYVLQDEDRQDYGSGTLRYQPAGTKYTYDQLIFFAGKSSDNTAAYVLVNLVGGEAKIQAHLEKLGLTKTSISDNTTTAKEMGDYLAALYAANLVSEKNKDKILQALTKTDFEDRLPRGVPDHIPVAHKIGNELGVYNDCGVILGPKPYILCLLTNKVKEEEALVVLPKISRLVWEFVNQ